MDLLFLYISYSSIILIALTVFLIVKVLMVVLEANIKSISGNMIANIVMFLYILISVIYFVLTI